MSVASEPLVALKRPSMVAIVIASISVLSVGITFAQHTSALISNEEVLLDVSKAHLQQNATDSSAQETTSSKLVQMNRNSELKSLSSMLQHPNPLDIQNKRLRRRFKRRVLSSECKLSEQRHSKSLASAMSQFGSSLL